MKRRALAILAASAFALLPQLALSKEPARLEAPAGTYVLEKSHASLTWRISHMGMSNYTARFKSFDVKLQYDPTNPAKNSVEATIDLASVETDFVPQGGRDFNAELRSESFFNVGKAQQATFMSKSVTKTGPQSMKVVGDLTFLGVSKPVTLDVVLNGAAKEHPFVKVPWLGFSAKGKLQRSAFGLNPMPQLTGIGDDVDIAIEAEFVKQ